MDDYMFGNSFFFSPDEEGGEAHERPMGTFEDDEEEIVIVDSEDDLVTEDDEEDLPEEVKGKSKKDLYAQLTSQRSVNETMAATLKEGFTSLSETLKPAPVVVKKEEVDMEAARKNFSKQLFEGDAAEATEQYVKLLSKPLEEKLAASEQKTFNVAVDLMRNNTKYKEIFEEDSQEIANTLGTYDPKFQRDPAVLKQVVEGIRQRKLIANPLSDVETKEKLKAQIIAELKEEGVIPDSPVKSKPTYASNSRRSSSSGGGKKVVRYTVNELNAAQKLGVSVQHYVRKYGRRR